MADYEPFRLNQGGQAMVEYILLLMVSVALVIGLSYQFFTPFQTFVKSSMGTYTACLLETGEVPRLGGPTNIKEDPSECGIQMGPKGTAPASGGSGSRGSNSNSRNRNSTAGSQDRDSGSSSSGGGSSGGSSRGAYFGGGGRRTGDGPLAAGKVHNVPMTIMPGSSGTFKASGESAWAIQSARERQTTLGMDRMSSAERAELEKVKAVKTLSVSSSQRTATKKLIVKAPAPREPAVEKDDNFDLGNLFRMLIIGIIILALIIVLGSQAYKLTKSWEK